MLSRKVAARLKKGGDDEEEEMAKSLIRRTLGAFSLSVRASYAVIAMTEKGLREKERERGLVLSLGSRDRI